VGTETTDLLCSTYELQVTICTFSPLDENILQRYPNAKLHILTEEEFQSNYTASYRAHGCSAAIDTIERIRIEFEAVRYTHKHPMQKLEPLTHTTLPGHRRSPAASWGCLLSS